MKYLLLTIALFCNIYCNNPTREYYYKIETTDIYGRLDTIEVYHVGDNEQISIRTYERAVPVLVIGSNTFNMKEVAFNVVKYKIIEKK